MNDDRSAGYIWPHCSKGWRSPASGGSYRPETHSNSFGNSMVTPWPFLSNKGRQLSTASRTTAAMSMRSLRNSNLSRLTRATSSTVVHQAGDMAELAVDHIEQWGRPDLRGPCFFRKTCVTLSIRGQRIAQLMRQRREKLILALIVFAQRRRPRPVRAPSPRDRVPAPPAEEARRSRR